MLKLVFTLFWRF